MTKTHLLSLSFLFLISQVFSQTINHPNFGLKSHPTLDIESVVLSENSTVLYMVIENRILDGSFCADKKIYLILPNGKRLKVTGSEGIPRCPEVYNFQKFGEKLYFSLTFPALPKGVRWVDVIEDCDDACFSFNSVILDQKLNEKIETAYGLSSSGKTSEARDAFEVILKDFEREKCSYEGAVYWNLVKLSWLMGDENKANEWLSKLKNSENPLKEKYIESLGIKY